jgi:quinol monooxygenase YgiN
MSLLIVAGRIYVAPGKRDRFLAESRPAIEQARRAAGCRDFVVTADPLEADRVNVFEEWESEEALLAFRGSGPSADMTALIRRAEVRQYEVDEVRSA